MILRLTVFIASAYFLILFSPPVWGYDDHGNRDPFWPLVSASGTIVSYDSDLSAHDMILEGIVSDASTGNFVAIVNGVILKTGDFIGAYRVDGIEEKKVYLVRGQEKFELNLKKGGE